MSDRQCPSCGGFCSKSGCERESTQPDDLADLLASIKSKHERIDEIEQDLQESSNALASAHETMAAMQAEVDRLKGEHAVLITLLNSAYGVIETIEPESSEESDSLNDLQRQIHKAINGAIQGLV